MDTCENAQLRIAVCFILAQGPRMAMSRVHKLSDSSLQLMSKASNCTLFARRLRFKTPTPPQIFEISFGPWRDLDNGEFPGMKSYFA